VPEEFPANFGIAEEGHVGNESDGMPGGFELVKQGINLFVQERLSEDVEKDGQPEIEGMELVEETPQTAFREVPFRTAEDVRRAKDAMHVAVTGELDKNRPRRGGDERARTDGDGVQASSPVSFVEIRAEVRGDLAFPYLECPSLMTFRQ
jgi:hypothetical protein